MKKSNNVKKIDTTEEKSKLKHQVIEVQLQKNSGNQGLWNDAKEIFEPITKADTFTSGKLPEVARIE